MDNKDKIKIYAIKHYDRMIDWVKTQDLTDMPSAFDMGRELDETWDGKYCSYCKSKPSSCCGCSLSDYTKCCDGLWDKMAESETWKEWLYWAYRVRSYIKKHG